MKLYVFAVYDKAVGAFNAPIFFRSRGEAIRSFTDACQDEKSNLSRFASDYSLMELGDFDDGSGIFMSHDPVRVIAAFECLAAERLPNDDTELKVVDKKVSGRVAL